MHIFVYTKLTVNKELKQTHKINKFRERISKNGITECGSETSFM